MITLKDVENPKCARCGIVGAKRYHEGPRIFGFGCALCDKCYKSVRKVWTPNDRDQLIEDYIIANEEYRWKDARNIFLDIKRIQEYHKFSVMITE